jgi:hypothetical protein
MSWHNASSGLSSIFNKLMLTAGTKVNGKEASSTAMAATHLPMATDTKEDTSTAAVMAMCVLFPNLSFGMPRTHQFDASTFSCSCAYVTKCTHDSQGLFKWTNGSIYEGEYRSGKKSGTGTESNAFGHYSGQWWANFIHGQGKKSVHV